MSYWNIVLYERERDGGFLFGCYSAMLDVINLHWLPAKEHLAINTVKFVHHSLYGELWLIYFPRQLAEQRKNCVHWNRNQKSIKVKHTFFSSKLQCTMSYQAIWIKLKISNLLQIKQKDTTKIVLLPELWPYKTLTPI